MNASPSKNIDVGMVVSYSCDKGYTLIGSSFINCTVKGFSSEPPICEGKMTAYGSWYDIQL